MKKVKTMLAAITVALALGGCGGLETSSSNTKDDVVVGPGRFANENTATLTIFSEAGLWGDSYVQQLTPTSTKETSLFIPPVTIAAKNLTRRISSARLVCGQRDADVFFFDAAGNTSGATSYQGRVVQLSCLAGRTETVNFHMVTRLPGNVQMGDRITSAQMFVHTAGLVNLDFSRIFASEFKNKVKAMLPSEAKLYGEPELTYTYLRGFRVKQKLKIDGGIICREGTGQFEYGLTFYVNAGFPGNPPDRGVPVWRVLDFKSSVDGGWYCHDEYESKLKTSVMNGRSKIVNALNGINFGNKTTYYMTPFFDGHSFLLNWAR